MEHCIELTKTGQIPTLLQMAHQPDNESKIKALIFLNIAALDEFLHLNNRLTEEEVETIAETIVQVYGGALSFADLNLIIGNAKRGVYGKFYERLSAADILAWVEEYYNARLNESASRTIGERERPEIRKRDPKLTSKQKEVLALGQIAIELKQKECKTNDE